MVPDDRLYLIHIKECIRSIEDYTAEGREAFFADKKTQDAVLRNLHILSESTQRVSRPLKEKHAEIDWRSITAFRNVVVHNYLGVDLKVVWDIVQQDLPDLKRKVDFILRQLEGS
ncbi:MAG: DUF86 domain-containing protein [Candidatus Abyssobacteria bacterium SURF_5]|uniref:DUF86 domain-containing protein n=1 Tax=Abyssobacteria bacterium (strain SURF_5) TaxID=2093360 RepID=A0A3A4P570_ABYX5|nr:MAG: DUF86 domain-containing protein [Candidatus Abyssubacteria bacterium SURF_5]